MQASESTCRYLNCHYHCKPRAVEPKLKVLQWNQVAEKFIDIVFERGMSHLPSHKNFGNFSSKCFGHLPAAHVGNAVQSKAHEGGVAAGQVVLDGIVYQADELAVGVHQHGDEQIAL